MAANGGGSIPPPPPPPPTAPPAAPRPAAPPANGGAAAPKQHSSQQPRPHHHSSQSKRAEDDKRKREKERDQKAQPPKAAPAADAADKAAQNRLRRETPFLATIRFKNDLPEVPGDPKMLVGQVRPDQLASFSLTTLEREPKRELPLPPDLGIPISLLDVERYQVPAIKDDLHPADRALLGAEGDDKLALASSPANSRHRARHLKGTEVSWLMRTTYISNDSDALRKQGVSEKMAKSMRQAGTVAEEAEEDRDTQIAQIEATFEAAKRVPKHCRNPELTPLEILPVLPDFDCWPIKYIQAQFDNDPTEEVEALQRLKPEVRRKVAARAMLKGFKVDHVQPPAKRAGSSQQQQQPDGQRFMALVVPEAVPEASGQTGPSQPQELQGDYLWSREYSYDLIRREQDAAEGKQEFFVMFKDGVAAYSDINARMVLSKRDAFDVKSRGRQAGGRNAEEDAAAAAAMQQFVRPSKVIIRVRDPTEAEERERESKLRRLIDGGWDA